MVGARNGTYFRIVAAPTRSKRDGKSIEIIGSYNPKLKKATFDNKKLNKWINNGAILTPAVRKLIKK